MFGVEAILSTRNSNTASVHYRDTDIRHLGQNVKVRTDAGRALSLADVLGLALEELRAVASQFALGADEAIECVARDA